MSTPVYAARPVLPRLALTDLLSREVQIPHLLHARRRSDDPGPIAFASERDAVAATVMTAGVANPVHSGWSASAARWHSTS